MAEKSTNRRNDEQQGIESGLLLSVEQMSTGQVWQAAADKKDSDTTDAASDADGTDESDSDGTDEADGDGTDGTDGDGTDAGGGDADGGDGSTGQDGNDS